MPSAALPVAASVPATLVSAWKLDSSWSASVTDSVPLAVRLPLVSTVASSVTAAIIGVPITAVSFEPVIVKVTVWVETAFWKSVTLTL
ncbi:hypothetical protein AFCDBAGC_3894 [Methylobacterium cerastii]|uniref:Secreted protein n=1 Tax=Methylobacterium cerastii TaxID=932741 RepID=A0ABQ4QLU2_9HYPH|nr:hypothetical protein AFCDBAGC_3894 [Methylobacterium cerastii]